MDKYFPNNTLAFCPYLLVGYPTMKIFHEIVDVVVDSGAHILELGIPFSDPSADGPTLSTANSHLVQQGYDLGDIFTAVYQVKAKYANVGVCVMGYYNTFLSYGIDRIDSEFGQHYIDSILIADLPVQEDLPIQSVDRILIAANNLSDTRLSDINRKGSGFVYILSSVKTTGAEHPFYHELQKFISRLDVYIPNKKRVVGFGIKNRTDVAFLKTLPIDGFVVGSEILKQINQGGTMGLKRYLTDELLF